MDYNETTLWKDIVMLYAFVTLVGVITGAVVTNLLNRRNFTKLEIAYIKEIDGQWTDAFNAGWYAASNDYTNVKKMYNEMTTDPTE